MDRGRQIRSFHLGEGSDELEALKAELDEMWSVLLGREEPPVNVGVGTLMEVAESYHARACEVYAKIQRGEQEGYVPAKSAMYKFRTGELRTFIEVCKRSIEVGSRRVTLAQLTFEHDDFPGLREMEKE